MKSAQDMDLVQAYLDGELSDDQSAALEHRLRLEPALADLLLTLARNETVYSDWAHLRAAASRPENAPSRNFNNARRQRQRYSAQSRTRRWLAAGLLVASAAALVFVSLFGGAIAPTPAPRTQPVAVQEPPAYAKVEVVEGDVEVVPEIGEPFVAKPGQVLTYGQSLRTKGDDSFAIISYGDDATRLELGNGTTIRLLAEGPATTTKGPTLKHIFLEEGTVAADVAKQPVDRPMVVVTPHAEARILESRASFTSFSGGTHIEHEKGQIQVTRKSDGRSIQVPASSSLEAPAIAGDQFAPKRMPTLITQARTVSNDGGVLCLAYSPDGFTLATGCSDGSLKLWNVNKGDLRLTLKGKGKEKPLKAVAYSPDGTLIAAGYDDKKVKLWDAMTGREVHVFRNFKGGITCLAWSADGTLLATGGTAPKDGPEIRVFNIPTKTEMNNLTGHGNGVLSVAFSPVARTVLATASKDGTVKIWDVASREFKTITLQGHTGPVHSVAFSPDGKTIATGSKDLSIKLWDALTGGLLRTLPGASNEVRSVAFSHDGKTLAAADNSVKLWDMTAMPPRVTFKSPSYSICLVAFPPNGTLLATTGLDKTIRFWDLPRDLNRTTPNP